jgi:hypothetical protein
MNKIIRIQRVGLATEGVEILVHIIGVCEAEVQEGLVPVVGPGNLSVWSMPRKS